MSRGMMVLCMATLSLLAAGCAESLPGTTRSLGPVSYEAAFAAARETLAQYFSIETADPETGTIETRPKPARKGHKRILSGSPARKLAKMRIRKDDAGITAYCSVAVERQGSAGYAGQMALTQEPYSSVPNQTPAELDAATTPQQNEIWIVDRYDHALERAILDDLYRRLHPAVKP